ncbi:30S ribosomal protein S20 [Salisediminibacterium selenitireducens]|uniref:Small ribosomal subunit protein bS20 n=1 Tax=Bacillus selenitireducens (strain ATCC 700615 / DSM 15326 / MLS10) TaxID=439292 RepID=D6XWC1_BACIE|nr:30S ribosomal protein S20 [Salisediminibacterium selenitireducens]ADH99875.1 ribosomal protein S20 [[Bacillus] selenitireducens MLS10]
MANIKSAKKRVLTNEKRRAQNASFKSDLRSSVKVFNTKVEQKDVEGAKAAFTTAVKKIDKAVNRGVYHKNKAARQKSALQQKMNGLGA